MGSADDVSAEGNMAAGEESTEEETNIIGGDHVMDSKDANLETVMCEFPSIADKNIMLNDVQGCTLFDLSYNDISDN